MRPRQRPLGPGDSRTPARRGKHGLTADEVAFLMSAGCAICGARDRALEIDHDHNRHPGLHADATGCRYCVRGAVCHRCNYVLRLIADDAKIAARMAAYLAGPA